MEARGAAQHPAVARMAWPESDPAPNVSVTQGDRNRLLGQHVLRHFVGPQHGGSKGCCVAQLAGCLNSLRLSVDSLQGCSRHCSSFLVSPALVLALADGKVAFF